MLKIFSADETYLQLRRTLLPEGRGRPPALPELVFLTNHLLLQLKLLQYEGSKSSNDVSY